MNVLSLFDGMSCGQIALRQLGIIPRVYYASEIDKYAIAQTQLNFPDTIQLGDVAGVDVAKLKPIDLLIGGSPCQSFSFAGNRIGMSTVDKEEVCTIDRYLELKNEGFRFEGQSYLFWEYMRVLVDIRKYNADVLFLLENVEMGNKWERVLSEAIGIYGVHINSALVSAQNRKRIYWTNIRTRRKGLFGELYSDIPQPRDKGICLKDILEPEADEKYYISQAVINRMMYRQYLSPSIPSNKAGTSNVRNNSDKMLFDDDTTFTSAYGSQSAKTDINESHKKNRNKACSTANAYSDGNRSDMNPICVAMRGREVCLTSEKSEYGKAGHYDCETRKSTGYGKNIQQLEPREDGKTNCLTGVQKDNLLLIYEATRKGFTEIEPGECFDMTHPNSKTRRGRKMKDKCNCLMGQNVPEYYRYETNGGKQSYQQTQLYDKNGFLPAFMSLNPCDIHAGDAGYRIRRLTPTEYARLQTIPECYKWECSDAQQYRMLGNGWTVDVIVHILSFLKKRLNVKAN